jgi:hypothetical protein
MPPGYALHVLYVQPRFVDGEGEASVCRMQSS